MIKHCAVCDAPVDIRTEPYTAITEPGGLTHLVCSWEPCYVVARACLVTELGHNLNTLDELEEAA